MKVRREAKMLDLKLILQILEKNEININVKAEGDKRIVTDKDIKNKINELAFLIQEKMILIGRKIRKEEEMKNGR